MFKSVTLLKRCLVKKGWEKTNNPQKGNPAFVKNISFAMMTVGDFPINNDIFVCLHTPDRCNTKMDKRYLEFYSPPN